jgi:hypothetical protein
VFTISGYGVSDNWPPKKPTLSLRKRLMATSKLPNLKNVYTSGFNIQISGSQSNDRGGICSGDSGGQVLWNGSDIIAGITSFGKHDQCLGNGFAYRVDQAKLIDWVLEIAATMGESDLIAVVPIGDLTGSDYFPDSGRVLARSSIALGLLAPQSRNEREVPACAGASAAPVSRYQLIADSGRGIPPLDALSRVADLQCMADAATVAFVQLPSDLRADQCARGGADDDRDSSAIR